MMARPSWRGHFTNALLPPRGAQSTPRPRAAGLPEIAPGWGSQEASPLQPAVVQAALDSAASRGGGKGGGQTTTTRAAAAPLPHATSLPNRRHGSPARPPPPHNSLPRSETNKQEPRSGPAYRAPTALAVPQSPAAAPSPPSAVRLPFTKHSPQWPQAASPAAPDPPNLSRPTQPPSPAPLAASTQRGTLTLLEFGLRVLLGRHL